MNVIIELFAVSFAIVLGLVYVSRMLRTQRQSLNLQIEDLILRLNDLTARMDGYEIAGRRLSREREAVVSSSLNQLQTDLKLMQMQTHEPVAGREAQEALEQAIKLARDGKPSDHIMRRTGLSQDVVDAITMLHSSRSQH
jgi:hypothetical protein